MDFVAATNNKGKLAEMQRILGDLGIRLHTMKELGISVEPDENGMSFEENARIKAEAVCKAAGMAAIADDSGLCIDALGGSPGIYSARYGSEGLDDAARSRLILSLMQDIPEENRTARFVCSVCVVEPSGRSLTAQGTCEGRILGEPVGNGGFGYDPIFCDLAGNCFGEVSQEVKNGVSHRNEALQKLAAMLRKEWNLC